MSSDHTSAAPAISLVVPLYNEEENVVQLVQAVKAALHGVMDYELILVDDGSTDRTAALALEQQSRDTRLKVLRLARNYGQTQALQAGFDAATGGIVVSMDGDLQNDPEDIPALVSAIEDGYDLVAGYRVRRKDSFITRKIPSYVANRLIAAITGVNIRDNGCTLKAFRRSLLRKLDLYSDMHRFLPALAVATAGARVAEIPVRHHPRLRGASKYGLSRIAMLLADMLTLKMITSFREHPFRMFGIGALGSFAMGGLFFLQTMRHIASTDGALAGYAYPTTALLWIALSAYLILLGLVAEVALHQSRKLAFHRGAAAAGDNA